MQGTRPLCLTLTLAALGLATGCHVSTHDHGRNNDVDIGTPFGSMHVKTDQAANLAGLGLTPYPGATPYNNKHNNDAADINMSFGSFHLGVKAASFLSHDSQDQILAFYRKDLARYGEVLECRGNTAVGEPVRTSQGLTCDENKGRGDAHVAKGSGLELRTGSPQHQHIVAVESEQDGNKIGLVALDLPGHLGSHKDEDVE